MSPPDNYRFSDLEGYSKRDEFFKASKSKNYVDLEDMVYKKSLTYDEIEDMLDKEFVGVALSSFSFMEYMK